jgi:LEA14-like dessication related protein
VDGERRGTVDRLVAIKSEPHRYECLLFVTEALMSLARRLLLALLTLGALLLGGCATMQHSAIDVTVVGIDPLDGEGLELRMLVKLRVQNPNDSPLDFNGVSVEMDVQGKRFATGVADVSGTVPRFGETVIAVPVSISAFRMAGQVMGLLTGGPHGKLAYDLSGKLAGPGFGGMSFRSSGEVDLPEGMFGGGS